ncbi:uncharacterized protein LOC129772976 [Toxorhynchites rutilus septentrionalis]|uniref:uncharacterized protein LOC129772976 n=1 Tax=Toxorhynchites rutilus septentrionalis TaxID=329112 RepID=UPI00247843CD|nr:uncharacterized protein LOC129772976 [Toxorhynchites rutilus septentrionalis]
MEIALPSTNNNTGAALQLHSNEIADGDDEDAAPAAAAVTNQSQPGLAFPTRRSKVPSRRGSISSNKRTVQTTERDKTKNITTTKKQFERLVQLLEKNPDIAKGFMRGNSGPFWNDCAAELNSLGPSIRDGSGWKKVWADYKSALKRKLSHNKREQWATGGGPNRTIHLSELEEQAVQLTGQLETVEGIPGCSSQGIPKGKNNEVNTDVSCDSIDESDDANDTAIPQCSQPKRPRLSALNLVQIQIEQQQKFHSEMKSLLGTSNKNLNDMVHYQRQFAKAINSIDTGLKEMLKEQNRHNREMEKIAREKVKK